MAKSIIIIARGISIRFACACLNISESCFYYQSKQNTENEQIADWLLPYKTQKTD